LIVSTQHIACSAPCVVHGLLYADVVARDATDLSAIDLRGAAITRGNHAQAAGSAISYDAAALQTLRRRVAVFARVPGSWRDY
jgi:hypothetical protein